MKYVILHGEGLAARAYPELGGKTPLQAAATPNMDRLVHSGELGLASLQCDSPVPPQEVMPLGLLGYDPRRFASGPAPFEAAALGVALGEQDIAFRGNMVTLKPQAQQAAPKAGRAYPEIKKLSPQLVLDDDTAGGLTTEEARELIDAANEQLGSETIQFYPGIGHRHIMVWVGGKARAACVDPHEVVGRLIGDYLPKGDGADILRRLMEASLVILGSHPVNDARQEMALKPANCLWLWGQGKAPKLPSVLDRFHVSGTLLSSNDLVRGVGVCAGLETLSPEEFAQNGPPDFPTQAERALREVEKNDFLYLHVEIPGAEPRLDDPMMKRDALEQFDKGLVGVVVNGLEKLGPYRLLLVGEVHASVRKPGAPVAPALYALVQGAVPGQGAVGRGFNEADAEAAQAGPRDATKLVNKLFARR